ncbi:MAG: diphthine--ammonia ligase [Candidatus Diapherotrites archaeon]
MNLNKKQEEFLKLMDRAIGKPEGQTALLFSGGVDSTLLAMLLKRKKIPFEAFISVLDDSAFAEPKDLAHAKKVSKELGFKLNIVRVKLNRFEKDIENIAKVSHSQNSIELGISSTFYYAAEFASKKKFKTLYYGLGPDETFCGYSKFENVKNINKFCKECAEKAQKTEVKIIQRIAKNFKLKVNAPYMQKKVVDFSLAIPSKEKISKTRNKIFIRDLANTLGLKKEFSERKKLATQYGSNFDKALGKIAKKKSLDGKQALVESFSKPKLCSLFSSGKDSTYSLYLMQKQGYDVVCLAVMNTVNPNSYMYHKPDMKLVELQSQALGIPLLIQKTKGVKEKELRELELLLKKAKQKYCIEGVITGALFSNYQRERIAKICKKLKLECFNPLWHKNQEEYMKELIDNDFKFIFTSIACYGLDEKWLGKTINNEQLKKLIELNKTIGINVAGEGGEFESLVLNAPNFRKKIEIQKSEKIMGNEFTGLLKIKKAVLKKK